MSNRTALITIMTDLDSIDDRLRAVSTRTSSIAATNQIAAGRDAMVRAKLRLAAALVSIDPVIDLPVVAARAAHSHSGAAA